MKKMTLQKNTNQGGKKRKAWIFFAASCLVFLILIILDLTNVNLEKAPEVIKKAFNIDNAIDISGNIISPIDKKGVADLDITFGTTSLRTDESGFYEFFKIKKNEGFKINHPELRKSILKKENQGKSEDFYFDIGMMNSLITVVELESRGKFSDIYEKHLYQKAKENLSEVDFIKNYKAIFDSNNLSDQELVINKTTLLQKEKIKKYDVLINEAVKIEVSNQEKTSEFYLIFEEGKWSVVK